MNPKVTIIIPAYNCEKFIELAVLSCINQDYKNKEIIIVDNESTDLTLQKINKLKNLYPELIVDTAKNIYKYSWQEPVEKAWELMTGEYFTIIGSDDYLDKSYISNCMEIMLKNDLELMQSNLYFFNDVVSSTINVYSIYGHSYQDANELKRKLLEYCCVASPSVFYKSSVLKTYEMDWKSDVYYGACDYYMYCSLVDQGAYIYPTSKFLGYFYRTHPGQSTHGMVSDGKASSMDKLIKSLFASKWRNQ